MEAIRLLIKLETNKLPASFNGLFPLNRDRHPHRHTRQSNLFVVKLSKTSVTKNLPGNSLPKIWNHWKSEKPENVLFNKKIPNICKKTI